MATAESYESPITWEGKHIFFISGTTYEDDTLKIVSNIKDAERPLVLVVPTLCITYADMAFANAVGGQQADYPDAENYGPAYFDPPVELRGDHEIRKFTWIRGADEITIGEKETVISWRPHRELVIPKLRIAAATKVKAVLMVPEIYVPVSRPVRIQIMQFVNGRHVGGVEVNKAHPAWKPEVKEQFDLWVRVRDERKGMDLDKVHVTLQIWVEEEGRFVSYKEWVTDKDGLVRAEGLDCGKMLMRLERSQYVSQDWTFRPFAGQLVRRAFNMLRL